MKTYNLHQNTIVGYATLRKQQKKQKMERVTTAVLNTTCIVLISATIIGIGFLCMLGISNILNFLGW